MKRTIEVVFEDGVLRPVEPLDLEPNGRYQVTIEPANGQQPEPRTGVLDDIIALARDLGEQPSPEGVPSEGAETEARHPLKRYLKYARDLGLPSDFAEQHDHYLYGTPKR